MVTGGQGTQCLPRFGPLKGGKTLLLLDYIRRVERLQELIYHEIVMANPKCLAYEESDDDENLPTTD